MNLARQSSVFPVLWQGIPCHDQASAWLLGDVAETEQSSSVAGVRVLHLFFMLCLHHLSLCLSLLKVFLSRQTRSP